MFLRYVLVMGCLIMDVSKRLIIFHDIYCINNTQTGFIVGTWILDLPLLLLVSPLML